MANVIICPTCQVKLRFSENSQAKTLRCPRCSTSVPLRATEPLVLAPAPPAKEVEVDDEPSRSPKRMRRERARTWVMGPAIGLISIGGIALALLCLSALISIVGLIELMGHQHVRINFGALLFDLIIFLIVVAYSGFLLFAGIEMVSLRNYVASMAGCVMLVIPSLCGVISMFVSMPAFTAHLPGAAAIAVAGLLGIFVPGLFLIIGLGGAIILAREDIRRIYS